MNVLEGEGLEEFLQTARQKLNKEFAKKGLYVLNPEQLKQHDEFLTDLGETYHLISIFRVMSGEDL